MYELVASCQIYHAHSEHYNYQSGYHLLIFSKCLVFSLSVFKSRLKMYFFYKAFDLTPMTDLPLAPLKSRP